MKYLANIVTKSKVDVSPFFNVISDINSIDINIPTLIVGWKEVKSLYPEQDILEKQITPTISWTFSKREKRYRFEEDIVIFVDNIIKNLDKLINYRFFNYILSTEEKRKCFMEYIRNNQCSMYHNANFLYIYNPSDKITIGVSLKDLRYIGINTKDLIDTFVQQNKHIISNNIDFTDSQSFSIIKDNIKVIPYLNYLKNSDIYI